jgi:hypothetical protein
MVILPVTNVTPDHEAGKRETVRRRTSMRYAHTEITDA